MTPTSNNSNSTKLCLKFQESDEFIVDCPFSNMCMKKIYQYKLLNGSMIETVSRDCAMQKRSEHVNIF